MKAAARSSASPPISPIITIASVSGSSWNALRQSTRAGPMIGSPPIPTPLRPPPLGAAAASIRVPCLRPSAPVMACTMIRLWPVRKIAISRSRHGHRGQLGGALRRVVHGRDLLDHGNLGCVEYPPPLGRFIAVEAHHDRVLHRFAPAGEHPHRGPHPLRYPAPGG